MYDKYTCIIHDKITMKNLMSTAVLKRCKLMYYYLNCIDTLIKNIKSQYYQFLMINMKLIH